MRQSHELLSSRQTNGAAVRRVFSDVVDTANQWTVRVICENRQVALGIVVGADGQIRTKASQLRGDITCKLADGRSLPANCIGHHQEHDLALLKVDAEQLPTVEWQKDGDPGVGRWVVTPDQEGAPRAIGIMSVERRSIPPVQTRGVLGIRLVELESPAQVAEVFPGSAAENARLQPGDVIHKVNEISVHTRVTLVNEIGKYRPGDRLLLSVEREGEEYIVPATLSHPFGDFMSRIAMQNQMGGRLVIAAADFPRSSSMTPCCVPRTAGDHCSICRVLPSGSTSPAPDGRRASRSPMTWSADCWAI